MEKDELKSAWKEFTSETKHLKDEKLIIARRGSSSTDNGFSYHVVRYAGNGHGSYIPLDGLTKFPVEFKMNDLLRENAQWMEFKGPKD